MGRQQQHRQHWQPTRRALHRPGRRLTQSCAHACSPLRPGTVRCRATRVASVSRGSCLWPGGFGCRARARAVSRGAHRPRHEAYCTGALPGVRRAPGAPLRTRTRASVRSRTVAVRRRIHAPAPAGCAPLRSRPSPAPRDNRFLQQKCPFARVCSEGTTKHVANDFTRFTGFRTLHTHRFTLCTKGL